MKHYICTGGCKGVSEKPGVCGAVTCVKHKHPLEECNCTDGNHFGKFISPEQMQAPKAE